MKRIANGMLLFVLAALSASSTLASTQSNESRWVHTTYSGENQAVVDWYLYRNTLVSLNDNGKPQCIKAPVVQGCYQAPTTNRDELAKIVTDSLAAKKVMVCGSPEYAADWGTAPTDPNHWCNAYVGEALTVRARIAGGVLTSSKYVLTHNVSATPSFNDSHVGFVVPSQTSASGPASLVWEDVGTSLIDAIVTNTATRQTQHVLLRANRLYFCGYREKMNTAVACDGVKNSQLQISFDSSDNPGLAPGNFTGAFSVDAVAWHTGLRKTLSVRLDIVKQ